MSRGSWLLPMVLLPMVLLPSCDRLLPLSPLTSADAVAGPTDSHATDLRLDRVWDLGSPEGSIQDGPDLPRPDMSPLIGCTLPTPVNDMKDDTGVMLKLVEPAMRVNDNTLVARQEGESVLYWATRNTDGETFSPWKKWGELLDKEDPSFYKRDVEYALVAAQTAPSAPRTLQRCTVDGTAVCVPVDLSPLLTADLDGPDMRQTAGVVGMPAEELVFAAQVAGVKPDLYLGQASGDMLLFQVQALALNTADVEDDPALTPDGLFLVFASDRPHSPLVPGGQLDLWIAVRTGQGYQLVPSPAQEVFQMAVNSSGNDAAPDLVYGGLAVELYFHSDRGGQSAIYRTACTLQ